MLRDSYKTGVRDILSKCAKQRKVDPLIKEAAAKLKEGTQ